jgi:hypothetical protein
VRRALEAVLGVGEQLEDVLGEAGDVLEGLDRGGDEALRLVGGDRGGVDAGGVVRDLDELAVP